MPQRRISEILNPPKGLVNEYCKGCKYVSGKGMLRTCDYCLITGEVRGCPAGTGCTKKETGRKPKAPIAIIKRRNEND